MNEKRINKLKNKFMKAKFVNESLEDNFDLMASPEVENDEDQVTPEEEETIDDSPFSKVTMEEDDDDLIIQDEFESRLNNELTVPEYARTTVSFRIKGEDEIIDAVPMAKMKDGSFLMKIGDKYRKFKMDDIIEESYKGKNRC